MRGRLAGLGRRALRSDDVGWGFDRSTEGSSAFFLDDLEKRRMLLIRADGSFVKAVHDGIVRMARRSDVRIMMLACDKKYTIITGSDFSIIIYVNP